jgi:hypothetical protein
MELENKEIIKKTVVDCIYIIESNFSSANVDNGNKYTASLSALVMLSVNILVSIITSLEDKSLQDDVVNMFNQMVSSNVKEVVSIIFDRKLN